MVKRLCEVIKPGMTLRQMIVYTCCEEAMTSAFEATVVSDGKSGGQFDAACNT
jgi:hypothetical protein